jgi:iron(III) transport system ATP-binding protein
MALQAIHGNSVEISRVSKSFKAFKAIDEVSLRVAAGEFVALLGPSSGGKTTVLRMIAGLVTPDAGSIRFDDTAVFDAARRTNVPAERRNIGMVFQDYALWPHLRVRDNVGFPLRARKVPKERHAQMIERALARVEMGHLGDRFPGELSGGQQQRVALARATVDEPRLLLFDEPLSNLDAALRESLGREIKALVNSLGATAIYVTHDQSEAFGLADRIAVMHEGRLVQEGAPHDLYRQPSDLWMARFLRAGNLIPGIAADGAFQPTGMTTALSLPGILNGHAGPMTLMMPANALRVGSELSDIRLNVTASMFRGDRYEITAYLGEPRTAPIVHFWHERSIQPGERVSAALDHARLRIFEEELT